MDIMTVVSFIMLFLIQQSQSRDTTAIHIKLNELIKAKKGIDNKFAGIEEKTDQELEELKQSHIKS